MNLLIHCMDPLWVGMEMTKEQVNQLQWESMHGKLELHLEMAQFGTAKKTFMDSKEPMAH